MGDPEQTPNQSWTAEQWREYALSQSVSALEQHQENVKREEQRRFTQMETVNALTFLWSGPLFCFVLFIMNSWGIDIRRYSFVVIGATALVIFVFYKSLKSIVDA